MDVYYDNNFENKPSGYHPYTGSNYSNLVQYYDFKQRPELIPTALEDYVGYSRWPAIQRFYEILAWLNGPGSFLESNDCAFMGPHTETDPKWDKTWCVSGRLMIFYRDLKLNLSKENVQMMSDAVTHYLGKIEPDLMWQQASVGLTVVSTIYQAFNRVGRRLQISFWAWGDTEDEAFANLNRLFTALHQCLIQVSTDIENAIATSE
jgi:hypothetical protein